MRFTDVINGCSQGKMKRTEEEQGNVESERGDFNCSREMMERANIGRPRTRLRLADRPAEGGFSIVESPPCGRVKSVHDNSVGFNTGNGEKLIYSQRAGLACLCLAVA